MLLGLFGLCGLLTSLPFVLMGAWPVAGFIGLDILALYFAFRVNMRDARAYEDVAVTPLALTLAKVSAAGQRRAWRFNPLYTRVEQQEVEDFGLVRLDLVSRDRRVEVGGFLGPEARGEFARELRGALATARRGPRFN